MLGLPMSKLRFAKLLTLIVLAGAVYLTTVYGFDSLISDFEWIPDELLGSKYLLGIFVAIIVVLITNKISRQVYLSLRQVVIKLSLADFVLGIISSIIGLILGALASVPFASIPDPWSWVLSMIVVILTTALAIWAFNLKKQTILEWFNSIHFFQRSQVERDQKPNKAKIEEARQEEYINPMVLDTSAIIDYRIGEIVKSGFLFGTLIVPNFILEELQQVADSSTVEKRRRGRHGLKLLQQIKRSKKIVVVIVDDLYPNIPLVDSKLIKLASDYKAKIITCDYNLNSVAKVKGVSILNINELASNLKHHYLPGEIIDIKVSQAGKEDGQGLGYLTDGTVVVVQKGRSFIGKEIKVEVLRELQSVSGRMLFARTKE